MKLKFIQATFVELEQTLMYLLIYTVKTAIVVKES
jgi:hypothetical protein